ncbi:MAG TPA: LacI family DNA-binding transcriptional regulator [Gemmatimonadales bacterium]|nr:LacI family DNA-binding transcriptional regulator [Gemmatimonadales bacterium]
MVTIKDVARAARVSVATVSRVHNGSPNVTDSTRRRVRAVATKLGYSPNAAARSLSTRKTLGLGVLLPDLYGEFYSELIRGIDQTAQQRGFHILVASSHNAKQEIAAAIQSLRGRVDGLIVMAPAPGAHRPVRDLPASVPVVLLNCPAPVAGYDSIAVANADGARDVVRHLAGLGHRRIAIIHGPPRNHDAAERARGYREALAEAGITPGPADEVAGDFTDGSGYRAALGLARAAPRPTAVFAANDAMAIGAVSAFREAGMRIPEDVAVAGFDDIPMARYMHPPLTTVRVDISDLGARATARLLDLVANGKQRQKRRELLPAVLVVRESCGGHGRTAAP